MVKRIRIEIKEDIINVERKIPYDLWQKLSTDYIAGRTIIQSNILSDDEVKRLKKYLKGDPIIDDESVYKRHQILVNKIRKFKEAYIKQLSKVAPPVCPKCGSRMTLSINGCQVVAKCTGCCMRIILFTWC